MSFNARSLQLPKVIATLLGAVFVLLPFHAFLTVWGASLIGHYTILRLWKEVILLVLVGWAVWLLITDHKLRKGFLELTINRLIGAYLALLLLCGAVAYLTHTVTLKALAYGLLVDSRFMLFFMIAWLVVQKTPSLIHNWPKWIYIPAAIVGAVALLQYFVLPYNVLAHFGYNEATIYPYETINHNINYIRVMSTLRGANPLGAYLVLIIALLLAGGLQRCRNWRYVTLASLSIFTVILTFSRSAWLGVVVAVGVLIVLQIRTAQQRRLAAGVVAMLIIIAIVAASAFRHTATFQNVFTHTDSKTKIATSSNDGHKSALRYGLTDIVHQPLGRGPGTAGPASYYNQGKGRIAENFFVQIGQEIGWVGMALFIAINMLLAKELWLRRRLPLAYGLLAALAGITIINLLSHAWADDTLAYIFWGLAGMAVAQPVLSVPKTVGKKHARA